MIGLTYLFGRADYGDAVEDEWLIVYLLREISRAFSSLWIRVFDGDGEFLFVEAANVLPGWLSPSNDRHRAWIHQGKLQIVPLGLAAEPTKSRITLEEAIGVIRTSSKSLVQSSLVEAEAFYRLEKYPGQISHSLHHALLTVPRRLAYLLHARPQAVAPAVEAFYLRSPVLMKPLLSSSPSALTLPPVDFVTVSVRFTKVLFAQLKSQHFPPPPAWATVLVRAAEAQDAGKPETHSRLELGMKITCGFEMMAATAEESASRIVREVGVLLRDLEEDGDQVLPTDEDMRMWDDVDRDDDEAWLDINYADLERELQGGAGAATRSEPGVGFGDASAAADLRKIVTRFEAFLNDESAGMDGAEMRPGDASDEDSSDDGDSSSDGGSDGEDKAVSFNEAHFGRMMREMMGLPPGDITGDTRRGSSEGKMPPRDDDEEVIQQLAGQMESELKGHGVLSLEGSSSVSRALAGPGDSKTDPGEDEDSGDDIDMDYHLAKNLLESFKGQAGMAGPVGNILGMMGLSLPRDEGDTGENTGDDQKGNGKQQQQQQQQQ